MNKKISRQINDQVKYGLHTIDTERTVEMNLLDFLYTYKAVSEFKRFFHQPMHYPTLIGVRLFMGNALAGGYSILNELTLETLDKYLPEDIVEKIENGDSLTPPNFPFYYNLKRKDKFQLSATDSTEPSAFELIKEMGFEITKEGDLWIAENYNARFSGGSPLELLGLISLYQAKGDDWQVSDDKLDEFAKLTQ